MTSKLLSAAKAIVALLDSYSDRPTCHSISLSKEMDELRAAIKEEESEAVPQKKQRG